MTLREYLLEAERQYIAEALEVASNRDEAAKALGISVRTLYYKMRRAKTRPVVTISP